MKNSKWSRRQVLKGTGALGTGALLASAGFSARVMAAAPPPEPVTPALIEAAKKEGKVVWYSAMDLPVCTRLAKAFEAKYPGIPVRLERSGSERNFQRIAQERASRIFVVDVVDSADAAHFVVWKREGVLAPYVPEEIAQHFPAEHRDPDGLFATTRIWLCSIGYNTNLVKAEEAPKSYADLLDPKWAGKMIKAHPSYSGTVMTATQQIVRDLGWEYLEKLARQKVMQVQSAADPPKKLALGERAVQADGVEYLIHQLKEAGQPVEPVYATEGSPLIVGPNAIFKQAPNPNAARLFQSYCFSAEGQQLIIDVGGLRSMHPMTKEKPGRKPFAEIKTMKDDAAAVEKQAEEIKTKYTQLFRV
jgi:iron(III) transport system substrate-binding protein